MTDEPTMSEVQPQPPPDPPPTASPFPLPPLESQEKGFDPTGKETRGRD